MRKDHHHHRAGTEVVANHHHAASVCPRAMVVVGNTLSAIGNNLHDSRAIMRKAVLASSDRQWSRTTV